MQTITLPEVRLEQTVLNSAAGRIVVPGHFIPRKSIQVDPEILAELVTAARAAAGNAYAPYSRFQVGTAVLMADDPAGRIYPGANIENSSYGVTVCAERTGLFHCVALGFRKLKYLAVSTVNALDRPLSERSPCGVCRQALKEFTSRDIATDDALILIDNGDPDTLCDVFDIERLLPYGFNFAGPD